MINFSYIKMSLRNITDLYIKFRDEHKNRFKLDNKDFSILNNMITENSENDYILNDFEYFDRNIQNIKESIDKLEVLYGKSLISFDDDEEKYNKKKYIIFLL
jgi:hypothetical protein